MTATEVVPGLAEIDPHLAKAYEQFLTVADRRRALSVRAGALIDIALAAAPTTVDPVALDRAIRVARSAGVADREIIEAAALASILGVHGPMLAFPILVDELERAGVMPAPDDVARSQQIQQRYLDGRSFWDAFRAAFGGFVDSALALDPGFMEAFLDYTTHPWTRGTIEPVVKELIYVAVDISTTHLHPDGARFHIRQAIRAGATVDQLVEVVERAAAVGLRSIPFIVQSVSASPGEPT